MHNAVQLACRVLLIAVIITLLAARQSQCLSCTFYNSKINTTFPGPPVMTELKTNKTIFKSLTTGKFATLQCCVAGNPSPTVTWYKDNQKLDLTNFRYKLMSSNQSLWIQAIKLTDGGLYSCQTSNYYGEHYRHFKLKVTMFTVLQKPVVIVRPNEWSALVSTNVTLTCIVKKSSGRPVISWHYNSTRTPPVPFLKRFKGRHLLHNTKTNEKETWNSNLTIFNVTKDDEGIYFCTARNGAGSNGPAKDSGVLSVVEPSMPLNSQPPMKDELSGDESESMQTVLVLVIIFTVMVAAVSIGVVYWKRRQSGNSGLQDTGNPYPPDTTHELELLFNHPMQDYQIPAKTLEAYEIPAKTLELLQQQAGEKPFDFDVFISYSSQDHDFVKKVLYDELSTTHSVCIDFKDFEPGTYIGENIYNCIVQSRKTMLVVSKNFLNSVWTHFEMQIAQGRLAQGHDVLIPVIIEDISYNNLPKTLQHYRQTKTYLEYFNENVQPHFWDRLRCAIGKSIQEDKMEVIEHHDGNDDIENGNIDKPVEKDNIYV